MSTLLDAARWTGNDPEPHQLAAWNWLDQQISNEERDAFFEMFRAAPARKAPLRMEDPPGGPLSLLLAMIRRGEGGWESVNRGNAGDTPGGWKGLASMSLREVMAAQSAGKVYAVGAYQFTPTTMKEVVEHLKPPLDARFDPVMQNALAAEVLIGGWKRMSLSKYLLGDWIENEGNLSKAQNDLAYEWASVPNASGRGWYDGDSAGNRSSGEVEEVRRALRATRKAIAESKKGSAIPAAIPAAPPPLPPPPQTVVRAPVFFSQRDNGALADRSCFSSACAMLAEMVKPGSVGSGANADLDYLNRVLRHGDTINAYAQEAALAELGISARLVRNADQRLIEQQIERWGGLALGYIHRGALTALDSRSSGHWCLCWGADLQTFTLHDPMGRPDVRSGGFVPGQSGKSAEVNRSDFCRRWELVGPPYRYAPGNGWAMVIDGVRR